MTGIDSHQNYIYIYIKSHCVFSKNSTFGQIKIVNICWDCSVKYKIIASMYWFPPSPIPHQTLLGLDYRGSTFYISFLFIINMYCPRLTKYKKRKISLSLFFLHSTEERKSYRFGATWANWVNNFFTHKSPFTVNVVRLICGKLDNKLGFPFSDQEYVFHFLSTEDGTPQEWSLTNSQVMREW